MDLPFTTDQFLSVFRDYNLAIWPSQVIAYLLGFAAIVLAIRRYSVTDKAISIILASFWIWMGAVYHFLYFSRINEAAFLFGSAFILQGILLIAAGTAKDTLEFEFRADGYGIVGAALIVYALLVYPFIGFLLGHGYPNAPMFGVAPCPSTIFTFGMLLWSQRSVPVWLLIIPFLWALIGFSAVFKLGIWEDGGLLVAGALAITLLLYRNGRARRHPALS